MDPPYTTLTAYDLNAGTIKWQIGLGDDLRLAGQGIKGTGTAASIKGGLIVTATGLVFATAADRKVHVYDSVTGPLLRNAVAAIVSGSPMGVDEFARLEGSVAEARALKAAAKQELAAQVRRSSRTLAAR